jgi:nucleoside-diphosphate-sugar epimerase
MKKVVVTGGSGRLGQFVIKELLTHDYDVLSIDRIPPAVKLCPSWSVDLRNAGDLYEALRGAVGVVHLGAYQAPNLAPDSETFGNNVTSTYNVVRAAVDMGANKIVLASSTAAFGFIYAKTLWPPEYLPLDEEHPSKPRDSYGLSKVVSEQIASSFALAHQDVTLISFRFPGINFDLSYESFKERWKSPAARANGFWTYIDARDAATACRLALETKFHGHEIFIAAAPTSSMKQPTLDLVKEFLPQGARIKECRNKNWSCVDSTKAAKMLGFTAQHVWQNYLGTNAGAA